MSRPRLVPPDRDTMPFAIAPGRSFLQCFFAASHMYDKVAAAMLPNVALQNQALNAVPCCNLPCTCAVPYYPCLCLFRAHGVAIM